MEFYKYSWQGTCSIMKYFHSQDQLYPSTKEFNDREIHEAAELSPSGTRAGPHYAKIFASALRLHFTYCMKLLNSSRK